MAGKVLTKEDFGEEGGGKAPEDTSLKAGGTPADDKIPADQKFDENGNPIIEEPVGEEPADTKKEPPKGDEEPPPKPLDDFKPKHKTWEETEKARTTLERDFHTKASEAAELRRKLEQYERPPAPKISTIDERVAEITEEAGKKIDALQVKFDADGKPTQESLIQRDRDARLIWANADRQIMRLEMEEVEKTRTTHQTTVKRLFDHASKEGLKGDDELDMVGMAFDRTDPNLNLDDRVSQAVENVKIRISRLREGFVQKQKTDKEEKDNLRVLGRGSSRPGGDKGKGKEEDKPTTMSQQLAQMNESRRLKREDL